MSALVSSGATGSGFVCVAQGIGGDRMTKGSGSSGLLNAVVVGILLYTSGPRSRAR